MRLRPRVRVDVLSGFLGSGKTTLLRNYLAAVASSSIAVVINEYGAMSIDHRLIRRGDDGVHVVADGCACCAVAERLRDALLDLLREDAAHDSRLLTRILIETSGLADPGAILRTLRADENLAEYLEPGLCVVTFDALVGIDNAHRYAEVRRQLATADMIVLTKADLASTDQIRAAETFVESVNPLAARRVAGTSAFEVASLFDGLPTSSVDVIDQPHAEHAPGLHSFSLRVSDDLDWASFSIWLTCLLNRHGQHILRFKAILESEAHALPLAIHGVRHLVSPPQHLRNMPRRGYSDLVFIVDGLEPRDIERSLHAFLGFAALPESGA